MDAPILLVILGLIFKSKTQIRECPNPATRYAVTAFNYNQPCIGQ